LAVAATAVAGLVCLALPANDARANDLIAALSTFGDDNFDPSLVGGGTSSLMLAPIYDYLTMLDGKNRIIPGLATTWTVNSDGRIWTFKLRPNVTFHNGDPLTADDVVFSISRLRDPKSFKARPSRFVKEGVEKVEAPDAATVVFTLKQPAPDLLRVAGPTYGGMEILPRKYFEKVGADAFAKQPIGSGPYRLVTHEPSVRIVYEAQKSHPFRTVPAFSRLTLLNIPEESTRVAMLERGEAHMAQVSPDRAARLPANIEAREVPGAYQAGVWFWMPWADPKAPTADPNVRMALEHAVDSAAVIKAVYGSYGKVAHPWGIVPVSFFADPKRASMQPVKYDPTLARQMLAKAGYPNGFEIKLFTASAHSFAPELSQLASIVADYWSRIGVKVSITGMTHAELRALYRGAQAGNPRSVAALGNTASAFAIPAVLDADYLCGNGTSIFRSNGVAPIVKNTDVDQTCEQAMNEPSDIKRAALIQRVYDILRDKEASGGLAIAEVSALWAVDNRVVGKWQPIEALGIGLGPVYETIRPAEKKQ